MKVLSREDILSSSDITIRQVPVPEWGGVVFVKTMSGRDRDRLEGEIQDIKGGQAEKLANMRAKMAVRTLCNEAGELQFTPKDVEELGKKSAAALNRVFNVAQELAGFSQADVKELVGNS